MSPYTLYLHIGEHLKELYVHSLNDLLLLVPFPWVICSIVYTFPPVGGVGSYCSLELCLMGGCFFFMSSTVQRF